MPYSDQNESLLSALRKMKQEFIYDVPVTGGLSVGGYPALSSVGREQDCQEMYVLAEILLENPDALRQFGDRIYELMEQDIRNQQERFGWQRS